MSHSPSANGDLVGLHCHVIDAKKGGLTVRAQSYAALVSHSTAALNWLLLLYPAWPELQLKVSSGQGNFSSLTRVELRCPQWVYSGLCRLFSKCRTKEAHVWFWGGGGKNQWQLPLLSLPFSRAWSTFQLFLILRSFSPPHLLAHLSPTH